MPRPLQFRRRWSLFPILFLVLPLGLAVSYLVWFSVVLTPLQQQYLSSYMAAPVAARSSRPFPVRWILKTAPKRPAVFAEDRDVVPLKDAGRANLPLALSPKARAEGWTGLLRTKQTGSAAGAEAILREHFFGGASLAQLAILPICGAALFVLAYLGLRQKLGVQTEQEERHGRRTRGPELASGLGWARRGNSSGIRLRLAGKLGPGASFRIPKQLESSHILLMGDTGSGKSNAIRQILRQVQKRGETAIVYDPASEFVQEFYRPERGDYILNPLDARCPFWNLHGELDSRGVDDAIAAAMLPEKQFENGFFTDAPRRVLAALLRKGASVVGLLEWMSEPAEIERRLAGTPQAAYLDRKAGPQRAGVLASLNMIADSLDLLPKGEESKVWFTTAKWKFERTRWVFLTSKPPMRERILPLHSAWLDLLILRMMEPCVNPAKPVWFVLDELASLNKLPQLHTAVTENRKYGNPVVLGFQGRSQLEKRYGQDAEAMLSQPATKIFFKTSEPRAAKWIAETLGEIEVERLKESQTPGLLWSKRNYAMEIATKPLVMASEIAGLEPLRGYIKQENRVVPVRFAYVPKRSLQPEFIERRMTVPEPRLLPAPVAEPVLAQAEGQPSGTVQSPLVPTLVARQRLKTTSTVPVAQPESALPLLVEPAPEELEPRHSAFKKKEGASREWKPVD